MDEKAKTIVSLKDVTPGSVLDPPALILTLSLPFYGLPSRVKQATRRWSKETENRVNARISNVALKLGLTWHLQQRSDLIRADSKVRVALFVGHARTFCTSYIKQCGQNQSKA